MAAVMLPNSVARAVDRQLRVVSRPDDRVGEPAREQDEADGQELSTVREVVRDGHDHVGQGLGVGRGRTVARHQLLAGRDENRQNDEEIANDRRRQQRLVGRREDRPRRNRRQRAHQAREHP